MNSVNPTIDCVGNPAATGQVLAELDRKTMEQFASEITELERQYPPPSEQEVLADCRWFQEHLGSGGLAAYRGTHVVVYKGSVVGSGDDSLRLELSLARELRVHPQRLVIEYVPRPAAP
jgi:hypothetical protein